MAAAPVIEMPDTVSVTQELAVADRALMLKVVDTSSYMQAAELLKATKSLRQKIEETFAAGIKKAHELHKSLVAQRKKFDDPLDKADYYLKAQMRAYDKEQERQRIERERELEAAERKRQEEEKLADAIDAEARGDWPEDVDQILNAPTVVVPIVVPKQTPKVEGISYRSTWKARVTDKVALVKAAAANPQYMALIRTDDVAIGQLARALKGTANVPGIQFYEEKEIVNRG